MPPYTEKGLSAQDMADIYAFVRSRPRPPELGPVRPALCFVHVTLEAPDLPIDCGAGVNVSRRCASRLACLRDWRACGWCGRRGLRGGRRCCQPQREGRGRQREGEGSSPTVTCGCGTRGPRRAIDGRHVLLTEPASRRRRVPVRRA